jgi:hypothetical protein
MATYRINYQWTFKAGYHLLFVDGATLATEQFNTDAPLTLFPLAPGEREPFTNNNGQLFYHGWTAGFEFLW